MCPVMKHCLKVHTVHLDFTKRDQGVVYQATSFVTYIGIPTGMRSGAFSISQNQRYTGGSLWENVVEWILKGGQGYSFLIRELLEDTDVDYKQALHQLQTTPLISPAYFILAGTHAGQGAVISRARQTAVDTWQLSNNNSSNNSTDDDNWFLVQTNDDHWLPPSDERRNATRHHLMQYSSPSTMNAHAMYQIMNLPPTKNSLTTYTSVMSAGQNYFYSQKQNVNVGDVPTTRNHYGHRSSVSGNLTMAVQTMRREIRSMGDAREMIRD